ncbi:ABC transporter permease [Marinobacter bryozoorum]|uniref:ABC transporter permease n=1 Tax=Marinobacter bryozoorum TaxID=256324 RepID=UPI002006A2B3|nr:ABC transporter permease [Marinobacter bryozoorum]MCK7544301.1 ABC transporter permease [Marinobacter bryozoorum]
MAQAAVRNPWQVTLHVWYALFLRELTARVTADRVAWLWLLLEPIAHVLIMAGLRTLIGRIRLIPGADFIPWLIVGITTFFLFRNLMTRGMSAIDANRALFAYRQVRPADTVLVRCALEGMLSTTVILIMVVLLNLLNYEILPHDPLSVMGYWMLMWAFGIGIALIFSVVVTVFPESKKFISMLTMPLYLLSGVMIPIQYFPTEVRYYLMFNPLVHILEFVRAGFFEAYRTVDGISLLYATWWSLGALALGLLMHVRYKFRLMAQ